MGNTKKNTDERIGEVFRTTNFKAFKHVCGNRTEVENRVKKIEASVAQIGYIDVPIIVNEKMEIIDGQARYEYCKRTNTPIAYCIKEGLNIDHCIAMNISSTNWGIMDYISSYAARGRQSYILAERFINESPYLLSPTMWALTGTATNNNSNKIKSGNFEITQDDFIRGKNIIEYWKRFDDIVTNRKTEFLEAIGYCYLMDCVDNEALVRKVHQRPRDFQTIATITDAIDVLEDVYNVRTRNRVYIETEYFKYLDKISKGFADLLKLKRKARGVDTNEYSQTTL